MSKITFTNMFKLLHYQRFILSIQIIGSIFPLKSSQEKKILSLIQQERRNPCKTSYQRINAFDFCKSSKNSRSEAWHHCSNIFSFSASIPFYINLHTLKDRNFILHGIYFNGKANNSPPPVNYKRLNQ